METFQRTLEDSYWESYLKKHPEHLNAFNEACLKLDSVQFEMTTLKSSQKKELHSRIFATQAKYHSNYPTPKAPIFTLKRVLLTSAASISLLIGISVFYKTQKNNVIHEVIVERNTTDPSIELLTKKGTIVLDPDAILKVDSLGQISYKNQLLDGTKTGLNTLRVPYGKRSQIVLEDGSKLWVNSGSTVHFPAIFPKNERKINVEGEILIEVAKDIKRQFTVATSNFEVQVYGTIFNVNAYRENIRDAVVLVEGSVSVLTPQGTKLPMAPKEMIVIDNGQLSKKAVNTALYTSWTKGYLVFEDTPISEVLSALTKYYNISFKGDSNKLSKKTCSGKIYLSDDVNNVIETLSLLTNTSFSINK